MTERLSDQICSNEKNYLFSKSQFVDWSYSPNQKNFIILMMISISLKNKVRSRALQISEVRIFIQLTELKMQNQNGENFKYRLLIKYNKTYDYIPHSPIKRTIPTHISSRNS